MLHIFESKRVFSVGSYINAPVCLLVSNKEQWIEYLRFDLNVTVELSWQPLDDEFKHEKDADDLKEREGANLSSTSHTLAFWWK